MSELTLPGDIPGLLRRGSPVVQPFNGGRQCVVSELGGGTIPMARIGGQWFKLSEIALDLSDPTGRAHAAWWVLGQSAGPVSKALAALDTSSTYLLGLIDRCCAGSATAFDTEALRRIVLHVAGREVTRG